MKKDTEKNFGELVRRTLLAGVYACASLLAAGGLLNAALPGAGAWALRAGLLLLLLTPGARLAMMAWGWWRAKEYFFSAASAAVLLLLAVSALV